MIYEHVHVGQQYDVKLTLLPDGHLHATVNGHDYDLQVVHQDDGGVTLQFADQATPIHILTAADGDERYVHINGQTLTFTKRDERATTRRTSTPAETNLTAQMPGQVVAVEVEAGETVTRGQTLVILEAMKMEMRVTAPADGLVQAVYVAAGDVVERGQQLVELG